MEIQPDIYHIKGKGSNFYLCVEPESLLLIDVGMPGDYHKLFKMIEKLGRKLSDLKHILITHADFDHAGSLAEIVARTGAQVYASRETAVFLQQGISPPRHSRLAQIILASFGRYTPVSADAIQIIADGELLPIHSGIQTMASPGHTTDHFSFYNLAKGVLFAGDAFQIRNGRIQLAPALFTANKVDAAQSAIQLLSLAPATLACGHGTPLSNHGTDKIMAFFNTLRQ